MSPSGENAMTVKVLAVIAEAATTATCLDAAHAASHAIGDARVEALHVIVDPKRMICDPEEIAIQRLRETREGSAEARAAATRVAFDAWSTLHPGNGVTLQWKQLVGTEEETLTHEAMNFDVLVIVRPKNLDGADALHAAFFSIRHPFFLMPSDWKLGADNAFASHIAIAWNNTDGCRRAAEGVLPWLRMAQAVTILLIDEPAVVAAPLVAILKKASAPFTVHSTARSREALGNQIIREAHGLGADLMVMGAYRHNPFVEWLLGRTTRQILARCDLPLFLAH
jgi:nucleotide-binding universal stress UspA family protein